jgi:8-oxo-dGTP diphosphatase
MNFRARLAVAAVVVHGPDVLVSWRLDGRSPRGFVTATAGCGETPEAAAVRKVWEETGLLVAAGSVLGTRLHPRTGVFMYYVSAWPVRRTRAEVRPGSGLAGARWVSFPEAADLMPRMAEPVRQYLGRRHEWLRNGSIRLHSRATWMWVKVLVWKHQRKR